jgi:hypothetical protein
MVYATCIAPQRVHSLKARAPIYNISDEALLFAHRFSCCGTKKEVVSQPTLKIVIVLTGFETWFIEFDVRYRIIGPFFQLMQLPTKPHPFPLRSRKEGLADIHRIIRPNRTNQEI